MLVKLITGPGDTVFATCFLSKVRVAGAAALAGTVQIKQNATVLETLPVATAVGTERDYACGGGGTKFDSNLGILTLSLSAADTVVAFYN